MTRPRTLVALLATVTVATTALAFGGCAPAVPCETDNDCMSGAGCIEGGCVEVVVGDAVDHARDDVEAAGDDDGFAHELLLRVPEHLLRAELDGHRAFIRVVDAKLRHVDHDGFVRSPVGADIAFFDGAPVDPETPREPLRGEIESWDPTSGDLTALVHLRDVARVARGADARIVLAWGRDLVED